MDAISMVIANAKARVAQLFAGDMVDTSIIVEAQERAFETYAGTPWMEERASDAAYWATVALTPDNRKSEVERKTVKPFAPTSGQSVIAQKISYGLSAGNVWTLHAASEQSESEKLCGVWSDLVPNGIEDEDEWLENVVGSGLRYEPGFDNLDGQGVDASEALFITDEGALSLQVVAERVAASLSHDDNIFADVVSDDMVRAVYDRLLVWAAGNEAVIDFDDKPMPQHISFKTKGRINFTTDEVMWSTGFYGMTTPVHYYYVVKCDGDSCSFPRRLMLTDKQSPNGSVLYDPTSEAYEAEFDFASEEDEEQHDGAYSGIDGQLSKDYQTELFQILGGLDKYELADFVKFYGAGLHVVPVSRPTDTELAARVMMRWYVTGEKRACKILDELLGELSLGGQHTAMSEYGPITQEWFYGVSKLWHAMDKQTVSLYRRNADNGEWETFPVSLESVYGWYIREEMDKAYDSKGVSTLKGNRLAVQTAVEMSSACTSLRAFPEVWFADIDQDAALEAWKTLTIEGEDQFNNALHKLLDCAKGGSENLARQRIQPDVQAVYRLAKAEGAFPSQAVQAAAKLAGNGLQAKADSLYRQSQLVKKAIGQKAVAKETEWLLAARQMPELLPGVPDLLIGCVGVISKDMVAKAKAAIANEKSVGIVGHSEQAVRLAALLGVQWVKLLPLATGVHPDAASAWVEEQVGVVSDVVLLGKTRINQQLVKNRLAGLGKQIVM